MRVERTPNFLAELVDSCCDASILISTTIEFGYEVGPSKKALTPDQMRVDGFAPDGSSSGSRQTLAWNLPGDIPNWETLIFMVIRVGCFVFQVSVCVKTVVTGPIGVPASSTCWSCPSQ